MTFILYSNYCGSSADGYRTLHLTGPCHAGSSRVVGSREVVGGWHKRAQKALHGDNDKSRNEIASSEQFSL